ncbi:MAG: hypothetical protein LBK54_10025 [Propionibacteriaceae bacterium]|jgi:hypothetical protein|nr:hypothetical protein [Propionibacteriaceae bacterium]
MPDTSQRIEPRLKPTVVGLAVGAVVLALWIWHPLASYATVPFLILAALWLPSAADLAGRVLRIGAWGLGFSVTLWLIPLPTWLPRAGLIVALVAGSLAGNLVRRWRGGLARTLWCLRPPAPGYQVLALGGVALAGLVAYRKFLLATHLETAVDLLMRYWDHSSHFFMADIMRDRSQMIAQLGPAPDGSAYMFDEYPAAFQGNLALLMDLVRGSAPTGLADVPVFIQGLGLVMIGLAVLATAAVLTVLAGRLPAWGSLLIATIAGMTFVTGPGTIAVMEGHDNFPFALAMVVVAWAGAMGLRRLWSPDALSIALAGVVGATCTWTPLGVLAAGLVLAGLCGGCRLSPVGAGVSRVVTSIVLVLVSAITCGIVTWRVVSQIQATELFSIMTRAHRAPTQTVVAVIALLTVSLAAWALTEPTNPWRRRLLWIDGTLLAAAGVWAVAATIQYRRVGEVLYYLAKFGNGLIAIAIPVALASWGLWFASRKAAPADPVGQRPVWNWLALTVALPVFGSPLNLPMLGSGAIPAIEATRGSGAGASALVAATELAQLQPPQRVVIWAPDPTPITITMQTMTVNSLRPLYTDLGHDLLVSLLEAAPTTWDETVETVHPWLTDGTAVLIVPPDQLTAARQAADPAARDAIISWA